jgi:putative pyruvate formate lyase activating enzyme
MLQPKSMKSSTAEVLGECRLCPRCCGADRLAGRVGFCRAGANVRLYRYAPHFGEEPPLVGNKGSGTVFFSHCTLDCCYCQNYTWSQEHAGRNYLVSELAAILQELAEAGCHNWNLVSPTPWLPQIAEALDVVRSKGVSLPVVYNTSGYERTEILSQYRALADIYLTDLRYAIGATASIGSRAGDYVEAARRGLALMWERLGPLQCDENGVAISGVICRLLILPGHAGEAVASLEWLAENIGTQLHVSVMAQYQPAYRAVKAEPWSRRITRDEYGLVCDAVERLGFEKGWIQGFEEQVNEEFLGHRMSQGPDTVMEGN